MEPTLLPGDLLLVDEYNPKVTGYRRGEIVAFTPPGSAADSMAFAKRIIGVAGDTIDLSGGSVFVNGIELSEPYVDVGQVTEPLGGQSHFVVPTAAVFVLGDRRESSSDSRVFGAVPIANVAGTVVYRCSPADRMGPLG